LFLVVPLLPLELRRAARRRIAPSRPTAEEDPLIRVDALDQLFALPRGLRVSDAEESPTLGPAPRCPGANGRRAINGSGLEPVTRAAGPSRSLRWRSWGSTDRRTCYYLGPQSTRTKAATRSSDATTFLRNAERGSAEPRAEAGDGRPIVDGGAEPRVHPGARFRRRRVREALLARARALVMPSPFESLSMVLLEAWNHGVPVLVNARCRVTRGQTERANGGLYFRNVAEFEAALDYLLDHDDTRKRLGAQGLAYVDREYRWPTVMAKLEGLLRETAVLS
jgi:glycosyltransferase involved in cell wall biosynthesis